MAVGPPLYFALEVLGEALFGWLGDRPGMRTLHARVESAAAGRSFSWIRIGYGVVCALALIAALIAAIWAMDQALGARLGTLKAFIRTHFDAV